MAEIIPEKPQAGRRWLIDAWSACLGSSLEALTGETAEITIVEESSEEGDPLLWWKQSFSRPANSALWVGAVASMWSGLGSKVLSAAGITDAAESSARSTCFEVLEQATGGLAAELAARMKQDVRCFGGIEDPVTPPYPGLPVQVRFLDGQPLNLTLVFHPALNANLKPAPPALPPAEPHSETATRTIDLLLDVELPVSVSFGRAYLPLKEILKLSSGSIVELNRPIADPVEIIVNNCVVAKGEVVVMEGNYGVRISQIISRQERLRTLN